MTIDRQFQKSLSLEQIEDNAWGDPPADATRLVRTVYQLRRKPIGTMQVEDLRLLLLQQEGVMVLRPSRLPSWSRTPSPKATSTPATCSRQYSGSHNPIGSSTQKN